jgi:hypothetical protein
LLEPFVGAFGSERVGHDATNDEKGGGGKRFAIAERSNGSEVRGLIGLRDFGDDLARSFWDEARTGKPAGDFGIVGAGHVDDDGGVWSNRNAGEGAGVFGAGEGGEEDARGDATIGKRDLRGGGGCECSRDAGDDFEGNVVGPESVDFFGGPAEEERVAAFETNYDLMMGGSVDEEGVDVRLGEETKAGALAHVDALDGGGDEGEDLRAHERVVEDDAGRLEEAERFDGEEVGVTGASTD